LFNVADYTLRESSSKSWSFDNAKASKLILAAARRRNNAKQGELARKLSQQFPMEQAV
jgi:hypothetical protein